MNVTLVDVLKKVKSNILTGNYSRNDIRMEVASRSGDDSSTSHGTGGITNNRGDCSNHKTGLTTDPSAFTDHLTLSTTRNISSVTPNMPACSTKNVESKNVQEILASVIKCVDFVEQNSH